METQNNEERHEEKQLNLYEKCQGLDMNQNEKTNDYNIVIDTLQKKLSALEEIQNGCDNIRRSVGGGIGMMDSIRYEQIDELRKAIEREKAIAHVNETPKTEPVEADVLNKAGNVVFDDDTVWQLAQKVRSDLDRKSCPGVYMDLAMESIGKHAKQALAAQTDHIPEATKMVEPSEDAKHTLANPPKFIYLQVGDVDAEFPGEIHWRDVTWCADQIERSDLTYVRIDLVQPDTDIADAHRTLAKWLNEEIEAPIDRVSLAKVLAATECLAVKECVTAKPAPLVRLTEEEIIAKAEFVRDEQEDENEFLIDFANAIQDAMERINTQSKPEADHDN